MPSINKKVQMEESRRIAAEAESRRLARQLAEAEEAAAEAVAEAESKKSAADIKMVDRGDGHTFVNVYSRETGERVLRFHVHPDGKWNIQTPEMFGTTDVAIKGGLDGFYEVMDH